MVIWMADWSEWVLGSGLLRLHPECGSFLWSKAACACPWVYVACSLQTFIHPFWGGLLLQVRNLGPGYIYFYLYDRNVKQMLQSYCITLQIWRVTWLYVLYRPNWTYVFYRGKLSEKLENSHTQSLSYYRKAVEMNSSAVDPLYRLHASRFKLLCRSNRTDKSVLQVSLVHSSLAASRFGVGAIC